MIQSALFFILGLLVAIFFVILLGPSVWRRAFFLARRQVQAELPMTLAEIRADRDGLRAEHAVAASRLEGRLRLERKKSAEQQVTIGRQYEELKRVPLLENQLAELGRTLGEQEKATQETASARDEALEKAAIVQAELERLQSHLSAMEGLTDTLRAEAAAREADVVRLTKEMNDMRHDRSQAATRYNALSSELTAAQTELKTEKRRSADLQQRLEKLISQLSDAQEKAERLARSGAAKDDTASAEVARENAALREEMASIAAGMVAKTAAREGPDSPLRAILQSGAPTPKTNVFGKRTLANRIKDLQGDD